MKFRLLEPWPINGGRDVIPQNQVLECNETFEGINLGWARWQGKELPRALPITAEALDDEAAEYMASLFPFHRHRLRRG
jgi:hypothetical protein